MIFFGAWVRIVDEDDKSKTFRIVGTDEFDVDPRYISIDSPMARALLKKRIDDEVIVRLPEGEAVYYVEAISYDGAPESS